MHILNKINIKIVFCFLLSVFVLAGGSAYSLSPSSSLDKLSFDYFLAEEYYPDPAKSPSVAARMDIEDFEKVTYVKQLKDMFGDNIVQNLDDLDPWLQAETEFIRHDLNSMFVPGEKGIRTDHWAPGNLLLIATQKCSARCEHCLIFSSPKTKVFLPKEKIANVFAGQYGASIKDLSLSGGEIFLHQDFKEIISSYSVQSVVTNAFWAKNKDVCRKKILEFKDALYSNPKIDKSEFFFGFSVDRIHMKDKTVSLESIANVIEVLYEEIPEIKIDLMKVNLLDEGTLIDLFAILSERGYEVIANKDQDIYDVNFSGKVPFVIQKQGKPETARPLYIDSFPLVPVGRASLLDPKEFNFKSREDMLSLLDTKALKSVYVDSEEEYQYVVGPDGSVSMHNIYLIPPAPVNAGNFNYESWDQIVERIARDPIAVYSRMNKMDVIFNAMARKYPDFAEILKNKAVSTQQLIYMILLNPERRMFINMILLKDALSNGILQANPDTESSSSFVNFLKKATDDEMFDFISKRVAALREIAEEKEAKKPVVFSHAQKQKALLASLASA